MQTHGNHIGCVKAATEILGDKWTPQLLRFFMGEPELRFCQLQDRVGGINPRTLSSRLLSLEKQGIITKQVCESGKRCSYRLTPKGSELLPILRDMESWSETHGAVTASVA